MEGGTWKQVFEVWPAALRAGGTFAAMQWYASGTNELHLMTDVVSGVFSVICTALFLRFVWHPKTRFLLRSEREALANRGGDTAAAAAVDPANWKYPYTVGQTVHAGLPWVILILCCALWSAPAFKAFLNNLFSDVTFSTTLLGSKFAGTLSLPAWDMPALHNLVSACRPSRP
jgi:lactate permease